MHQTSNSSVTITRKDGQGYFAIAEFSDVAKLKGVEATVWQYDGLAKLTKHQVVDGQQAVRRDDLSDAWQNLVALEATTSTKHDVLFRSGVFSLKEGRHITKNDVNKILIHEDLARQNKLKLGDKLPLKLLPANSETQTTAEQELEIVGIFTGRKQEKYTGLSSDLSENTIFSDYQASQTALNLPKDKTIANQLNVFADSPDRLDAITQELKNLKLTWSNYTLTKNNLAFQDALEALSGIKQIIKLMTYAIMAGGVIVLSLILILWLRERIYEIGILLSIGMSKLKIMMQFVLELVLISLPALILSLVLGNLVVKQIIGGLISQDDTLSLAPNLLSTGGGIDSLVTFAQSYSLLLLIIVVSVVVASGMILIKKPKEILSKIS